MKYKLRIQLSSLKKAIKAAGKAMGLDAREIENVLRSAKVGSDAEYHTASAGVLAYYAVEETMLSTAYWEAPQIWHDFYQKVDASLNSRWPNPQVFSEANNSVEFAVYPI